MADFRQQLKQRGFKQVRCEHSGETFQIGLPSYGAKLNIEYCHYRATGDDFWYWRAHVIGDIYKLDIWIDGEINMVNTVFWLLTKKNLSTINQ